MKKGVDGMTKAEFREALMEIVEAADMREQGPLAQQLGTPQHSPCESYGESTLITGDEGLIVYLENGEQFHVTITKNRG